MALVFLLSLLRLFKAVDFFYNKNVKEKKLNDLVEKLQVFSCENNT